MTNLLDSLNDIEKDHSSNYYSPIFKHDFKTHKGYTLVKLPSLSKQDAKKHIVKFTDNLPGRSYNTPYLNEDEFYTDPNFHQFYRFKTNISGNVTNIHFRTDTENDLVDNMLENLQESFMIRERGRNEYLNELNRRFILPFYIPLIALSSCFLLSSFHEKRTWL